MRKGKAEKGRKKRRNLFLSSLFSLGTDQSEATMKAKLDSAN